MNPQPTPGRGPPAITFRLVLTPALARRLCQRLQAAADQVRQLQPALDTHPAEPHYRRRLQEAIEALSQAEKLIVNDIDLLMPLE